MTGSVLDGGDQHSRATNGFGRNHGMLIANSLQLHPRLEPTCYGPVVRRLEFPFPPSRRERGLAAGVEGPRLSGKLQKFQYLLMPLALLLVIGGALAWAAEGGTGGSGGSAGGGGGHGPSEAILVCQLVVLLLVGRLLGEALLRLKQPAVMGMLMAGLVLGPSFLGALFPDVQHALFPAAKEQKAMLDAVSQFGVLLILLMTGMETDLQARQGEQPRFNLCVDLRHHHSVRLRFHAR